jgi:hypothetical protein
MHTGHAGAATPHAHGAYRQVTRTQRADCAGPHTPHREHPPQSTSTGHIRSCETWRTALECESAPTAGLVSGAAGPPPATFALGWAGAVCARGLSRVRATAPPVPHNGPPTPHDHVCRTRTKDVGEGPGNQARVLVGHSVKDALGMSVCRGRGGGWGRMAQGTTGAATHTHPAECRAG